VDIAGLGTLDADAAASVVLEPDHGETVLTAGSDWTSGAPATVGIRTGSGLQTRVTVSLDGGRQVDARIDGVAESACR